MGKLNIGSVKYGHRRPKKIGLRRSYAFHASFKDGESNPFVIWLLKSDQTQSGAYDRSKYKSRANYLSKFSAIKKISESVEMIIANRNVNMHVFLFVHLYFVRFKLFLLIILLVLSSFRMKNCINFEGYN